MENIESLATLDPNNNKKKHTYTSTSIETDKSHVSNTMGDEGSIVKDVGSTIVYEGDIVMADGHIVKDTEI